MRRAQYATLDLLLVGSLCLAVGCQSCSDCGCLEQAGPRGGSIADVSFAGRQVGYVVGSYGPLHGEQKGWVGVTADGGKTWSRRSLPEPVQAVVALGPRVAVVAGARSIRRTADRGEHWRRVYDGNLAQVRALCFADARTGLALLPAGSLRTDDGGQTWRQLSHSRQGSPWSEDPYETNCPKRCRLFDVGRRGFAVFLDSITLPSGEERCRDVLLETRDGGRHWSPVPVPAAGKARLITDMHFSADGRMGWLAVWRLGKRTAREREQLALGPVDHLVLATRDGGRSWNSVSLGDFRIDSIVFSADGQRGAVAGDLGGLMVSEDGGRHWTAGAPSLSHRPGDSGLARLLLLSDDRTLVAIFSGGTGAIRTADGPWHRIDP